MGKLKVLDLFSGIGGFSLGLERTGGFETVAFCEIDPFCRQVLAKHWPTVRQYDDVRTLTADALHRDGIAVDVICGGFPCQDISLSGLGEGLDGARSGLWSEIARLVGELRPRHVIVENVSALLSRGLDRVLGDLASLGYDAEWNCIPASAIGAQHGRDRVWIVAYPQRVGPTVGAQDECGKETVHHLDRNRSGEAGGWEQFKSGVAGSSEALADAGSKRLQGPKLAFLHPAVLGFGEEWSVGSAAERGSLPHWRGWAIEPELGRVAHGVPDRAHRLKSLGNAVVPQIPELIGRAILESERMAA